MNAWQSMTSVSFVLAAALAAAGCASPGQASKDGDAPEVQAPSQAGETGDERLGEGQLLQRGGQRGGGRWGGGGGGPGGDCIGIQDGADCGGDAVSGDPDTLYQCWNGQQFYLRYCWNGCQWMPPGVADRCR